MVKKINFSGITHFYEVLAHPALHPALSGSYKWAPNAPKGSRTAGNSKNYKKRSKNRNIMGETYFYDVLGMPARRPTLPGAPNTPKGSRTAGNLKNYKKRSKNRNIMGETYLLRVLCMPAHHPVLPGHFSRLNQRCVPPARRPAGGDSSGCVSLSQTCHPSKRVRDHHG